MKYMLLLIFLILFFSGNLHAEDLTSHDREAAAFFEAGQIDRAIEAYESLLQKPLSVRQRAFVQYNLATALTENRDWERAVREFQSIEVDQERGQTLSRNVASNWSIARLRQSEELCAEVDEEELFEFDSSACQQAITLLKEALTAVGTALQVDRQLAVIEGREVGQEDEKLVELRTVIRQRIVRLQHRAEKHRLAHLTLEEGTQELNEHLAASVQNLEMLGLQEMDRNMESQFLKEQAIEEKRMQALWEAMRDRLSDRKTASEEEREEVSPIQALESLFYRAEQDSYAATDLLSEGTLWQARERMANAQNILQAMLQIEKGQNPLATILERRVLTRARLEHVEEPDQFRDSLKKEDQNTTNLASEFLEAMQKGMEEADLLTLRLLEVLQERLRKEGLQQLQQAMGDYLFYQQILQEEGETLQAMLQVVINLQTDDLSQLNMKAKALEEKMHQRREITEDEEMKKLLNETIPLVEQMTEAESAQTLHELLEKALLLWDGQKLLIVKLTELLKLYATETVEELSTRQQKIDDLVSYVHERTDADKKKPFERLQESITRSQEALQRAQKSLEKDHPNPKHADLYRLDAMHEIRRAIPVFSGDLPSAPNEILESGILEQGIALQFNHAVRALEGTEGAESGLYSALERLQKIPRPVVAPFVESVIEMERNADSNADIDVSAIRQKEPWNEVIPLVEEGLDAAEAAERELTQSTAWTPPDLSRGSHLQSTAHSKWKEALEKLQQPPEDDQQDKQQDEQEQSQPPPPQPQENEQEEQQQQNSPEQVFELLQQMDDEDQQSEQKTMPKQGLRPW